MVIAIARGLGKYRCAIGGRDAEPGVDDVDAQSAPSVPTPDDDAPARRIFDRVRDEVPDGRGQHVRIGLDDGRAVDHPQQRNALVAATRMR